MTEQTVCNYHLDAVGWDQCGEDFKGECAIAKFKRVNAELRRKLKEETEA